MAVDRGKKRSTSRTQRPTSRKKRATTSAKRSAGSTRPRRTRTRGSFRVPTARVGSPTVRHRLLLSMIMIAVLALSGRLIWVQGLDASARAEEAVKQRTVTRTIPALRGDILDRTALCWPPPPSATTCG